MEAVEHHNPTDLRPQTRAFFDLPRELRDEIYKHHHGAIPRTSGALRGYTDTPSSALLRTCQQVHQEAAPLFHRGLKAALLHECVCMKLRDKDAEGIVRHAGWTRVNYDRFNIWIRVGPEDDSEIGWLYDLCHIWQGGVNDDAVKEVGDEILALSATLKKLSDLVLQETKATTLIERRLHSVYSRVAQVATKVMQKDGRCEDGLCEEVKGTLKERQSQPSGLDMQQIIGDMQSMQLTVYPARTDLGNGGQD
jgi:hypothetical protein